MQLSEQYLRNHMSGRLLALHPAVFSKMILQILLSASDKPEVGGTACVRSSELHDA
jgi:hypothetical protein